MTSEILLVSGKELLDIMFLYLVPETALLFLKSYHSGFFFFKAKIANMVPLYKGLPHET